jgi:hypothetical protein
VKSARFLCPWHPERNIFGTGRVLYFHPAASESRPPGDSKRRLWNPPPFEAFRQKKTLVPPPEVLRLRACSAPHAPSEAQACVRPAGVPAFYTKRF